MKRKIVFGIILLFFVVSCQQQKKTDDNIDYQVNKLLSKMTLEEKVGQMNQYSGFWDATGPAPKDGNAKMKYEHIKNGMVGSILNVSSVDQIEKLQKLAVEGSRLGIPLIFGLDVIHGQKTLSPIPLAEAASWDLEAIEKSARIAAIEASANGVNWTFAPMVDICRDARWGRIVEGGGEDTYLGSIIGIARIKGFQGKDLSANNTIAACAKHFAGYGFVEAGREYNTVDIGTTTLYNVVLPPFKAAVDAGVCTVMNSFNILNGVPATGNEFLQRNILKDKWGFNGFVVSDWSSIAEMVKHGYARDIKNAAELAVKAGSDMDMESYAYVNHLVDLVKTGKVDESLINDAAGRILRLKFELGLFDDPYKYCDPEREKAMTNNKKHMEVVLDMAHKSIVLLKNKNKLLPFKQSQKKIAVIGALADDKTSPLGTWRVASEDNTAVSVLEGLKKYTNNYKYAQGVRLVDGPVSFRQEVKINTTDKTGMKEAIALAKSSEVVIMVLGEHGFQSGEARSRTNLGLPGLQQELLEDVYAVNKNIVLVLMNGHPLTIPWAVDNIPSIIEAWQLGTQSGNAIADVLFGTYNPSGKLPVTFPKSVGQCPIYYNQYRTGRPENDGSVFWSHYIDESNKPLFPFGYGLSYSTFKYSDLQINDSDMKHIKVSVKISNTSNVEGEEIAQLYIHDKVASIVRPVKELKGFKKINLKAKEKKTVIFTLTNKELGFFNDKGKFLVESGEFDIWVGPNSVEGLHSSLKLQ